MTCGAIHFVRLQAVLAVTTLSDSLVGNSVFPFHLIAPLLIQLCWRFHENGFQGCSTVFGSCKTGDGRTGVE